MSILNRLFGRRKGRAAPGARERAATDMAAIAAADPAPAEPAAALPEAASHAAVPLASAHLPEQPEVPLRSLQRYRQDPAFKNFMAKAQKRPGAGRRPGIPSDYFDTQQRPR